MWIGGDFNGHCVKNNSGKVETIGKYGVGESNEAGEKFVAFAMSHDLRVVNTYYEKAGRHKITYNSGTAESQIDYILYRSSEKVANIKDCKVILGESVTNQYRPLVFTLISNKVILGESVTNQHRPLVFTLISNKVILGESVTNQHRPLVCTLISNKVILGESVTNQHRPLVCTLISNKVILG